MTEKTELWDKLGKTDPAHTKQFQRGGGFRGTAIKPMWSYRRMTEEFGACGVGWGINEPQFQVVPVGEEILVYCTVSIWHETREQIVFGVGGDKVAGKNKNGLQLDDEAFKKAFTDGVTNALKMIGVGADVHMGMFDDNKYVNTITKEFEAEKAGEKKPEPKQISAAEQKRQLAAIDQDLLDCESIFAVNTCAKTWASIMERDGWSRDYREAARPKFQARRDQLQTADETTAAIQEQFPSSTVVSDAEAIRHPLNA